MTVSIDQLSHIAVLGAGTMGHGIAQVAGRTYPWQPHPVSTISTAALLVARAEVPSEVVGTLVKSLFAERKNLSADQPKCGNSTLTIARRAWRTLASFPRIPAQPQR